MTRPLPKWVMLSYAKLWQSFKERQFEHSEASRILGPRLASVLISHLKRNGWLDVILHPTDSRKRIYTLKSPDRAVIEMVQHGNK